MNVAGVILLLLGLPSIVFGFYLKRAPAAEVKVSKRSRRKKKIEPQTSGASSFIIGGLILSLIGAFAIVRTLMQG